MMYGLSLYPDSSIELFDITDSMVQCIVEDANLDKMNNLVQKISNDVYIFKKYIKTTYYQNKEDRKERVLELL